MTYAVLRANIVGFKEILLRWKVNGKMTTDTVPVVLSVIVKICFFKQFLHKIPIHNSEKH